MHNPKDRSRIGQESAEIVAAQALAWLASDGERLTAFLSATGLSPSDLAAQAADPATLGAVLDFLLGEDRLVTGFCDAMGLDYTMPQAARAALPGGEVWHWT